LVFSTAVNAVAITAVIVSGVVGISGSSWAMVSWLSDRHGGERRRIIAGRTDAYISMLECFDRTHPGDRIVSPEVDAKVVLFGSPQMQLLIQQWLANKEDIGGRGAIEDLIRAQAACEVQETKLNKVQIRTDWPVVHPVK
jgi:hypothetical protein